MTHDELQSKAANWLVSKDAPNGLLGCIFAKENAKTGYDEEADVFGMRYGFSVVLEVKISRTDLKADFKKACRNKNEKHLGHHRYYVVPHGMLLDIDYEMIHKSGWGLVICRDGDFHIISQSKLFDISAKKTETVMYSIIRKLRNGKRGVLA